MLATSSAILRERCRSRVCPLWYSISGTDPSHGRGRRLPSSQLYSTGTAVQLYRTRTRLLYYMLYYEYTGRSTIPVQYSYMLLYSISSIVDALILRFSQMNFMIIACRAHGRASEFHMEFQSDADLIFPTLGGLRSLDLILRSTGATY